MRTLRELPVEGKRVFVRVDYNVPLEGGQVQDDTRLRESLPTIEHLVSRRARVILASHLGRPKGKVAEEFRMAPVGRRLAELLGRPVAAAADCIGPEVEAEIARLPAGGVLLLQNLRFHPGEEANDPAFAGELAKLADTFVNDAFSASHRAHASVVGIASLLPSAAGLSLEKEVRVLGGLLKAPKRPFTLILGGAKISDKIGVLQNLMDRLDGILVGGGIANTFLAAGGLSLGESLVERERLEDAHRIMEKDGGKLTLPADAVVAEAVQVDAPRRVVAVDEVPAGWRILDIGPRTVELFLAHLSGAATILWNGPLGVWEMAPFAQGTWAIGRALRSLPATTVVGGGDLVAALAAGECLEGISHISTGGGAMLEFLEGKVLPGVAALEGAH